MASARWIAYRILYDGEDIGLVSKLKSISYTDNDKGKCDEIQLVFEDRNAAWLMGNMVIEKEHDLDVTIFFHDWMHYGEVAEYHCGNFTVDDISFSGRPLQCTVKGVSIPADSDIQTVRKSQSWQNVTVKQIVLEKMALYGQSPEKLYFNADENVIESVEQSDQTDTEFLKKLCEDQGLCIKIYKVGMVVFDKKWYDQGDAKYTFDESNMESGWSWNSTLNGTYTGATISYTNPDAKGKSRGSGESQYISVTVGEGPRILQINEHAADEAEARRKAAAKINEENEKAVTIQFTCFGGHFLYATNNFDIVNMGRCNGRYYTESVTHNISGNGHKMTVKGYKIFDRF